MLTDEQIQKWYRHFLWLFAIDSSVFDILNDYYKMKKVYESGKVVLDLIDNCADFSNGVDGCGVDEGQVKAEELIRPFRKAIKELEGT